MPANEEKSSEGGERDWWTLTRTRDGGLTSEFTAGKIDVERASRSARKEQPVDDVPGRDLLHRVQVIPDVAEHPILLVFKHLGERWTKVEVGSSRVLIFDWGRSCLGQAIVLKRSGV